MGDPHTALRSIKDPRDVATGSIKQVKNYGNLCQIGPRTFGQTIFISYIIQNISSRFPQC